MNWKDFEDYVEKLFIDDGYVTEQTPIQDDGADLFIYKNEKKTVVQVKYYNNRPINSKIVRELHGTKDFFDCDHAIIVTSGNVLNDAFQAANKLGIEIRKLKIDSNMKTKDDSFDPFVNLWKNYIMPLQGSVLSNNRISNKIIDVSWDGITRLSSTGKESSIDIEIFKKTVNHLFHHSEITRKQINDEYLGRASSAVVLILSQVEYFEPVKSPLGLKFDKKKYEKN